LAKSTWDSLDVQGSGFELLGTPIVSRLENQDVSISEPQGEKKPKMKKEKYSIKGDISYKNIKTKGTSTKEEYIQSSITTTEKTKKDSKTQTYKAISRIETANKNLQKIDDFNASNKTKKQSTKYRISNRDSKNTEESEATSESQTYQSHTSQKVTKYLTTKEKKTNTAKNQRRKKTFIKDKKS